MIKKEKNKKKFKSQFLVIGSLSILVGISIIGYHIYSDYRLKNIEDNNIQEFFNEEQNEETIQEEVFVEVENKKVDETNYDYIAVLEIPKIGLKRGFYNVGNRYNNIEYNVTMVSGSNLPDVVNGNLILMAHSGDAYISYFAYLYRLNIGDMAYVTYAGRKYQYKIVNIYEVPKNGIVTIRRNKSRTTLTMITCTKNNDHTQTVYISELVG